MPVEVLKISSESPERYIVDYAAGFVKRGRVVGVPTDTFYGLCADPFNLAAIERVFQVKGRAEDKALPILVDSVEQAVTLAREVPDAFLTLATKFWPGALTLDGGSHAPPSVESDGQQRQSGASVGQFPRDVCDYWGGGRPGNRHQRQPFGSSFVFYHATQIVGQLGDRLPLVLDAGDTGGTLASTIVRIDGNEWYVAREGAIPEADIHKAFAK